MADNRKPETPESKTEKRSTAATTTHDVDRVAMVSRRADGTPDQTRNFEVLGKDDSKSDSKSDEK